MPLVDPTKRGEGPPPANIDAEESVLGALLVSEQAMRRVRVDSGLVAEHFYFEKHAEIFKAIARVADRDGAADELLVANELPKHRDYIAELAAKVPAPGYAVQHARVVVEMADRRTKIEGAHKILEGAREGDGDLVQQGLQLAASDLSVDAEITNSDEIMGEVFDWLADPSDPEVFELPWVDLNESVLGGFRRKQMSVLAGWPKMGKSFVLDQMLGAFTKQGKRCAIFAYEVSRMERAVRHLTMTTGVASEKILRKQLSNAEIKRLVEAMGKKPLPFDYFETAGWNANRLAQRIIYGGYDVVAVDPITKIPGFEKTEIASEAVGRLTEVATRANCHVILVSHLNRSRGTDSGGVRPRPVVSDLRGSGMIEGDAHAVMFLHRDQDKQANIRPGGELYIDRSRLGPPKSVRVIQLSRTLTFVGEPSEDDQTSLDVGKGVEPPPGHDQQRET